VESLTTILLKSVWILRKREAATREAAECRMREKRKEENFNIYTTNKKKKTFFGHKGKDMCTKYFMLLF